MPSFTLLLLRFFLSRPFLLGPFQFFLRSSALFLRSFSEYLAPFLSSSPTFSTRVPSSTRCRPTEGDDDGRDRQGLGLREYEQANPEMIPPNAGPERERADAGNEREQQRKDTDDEPMMLKVRPRN